MAVHQGESDEGIDRVIDAAAPKPAKVPTLLPTRSRRASLTMSGEEISMAGLRLISGRHHSRPLARRSNEKTFWKVAVRRLRLERCQLACLTAPPLGKNRDRRIKNRARNSKAHFLLTESDRLPSAFAARRATAPTGRRACRGGARLPAVTTKLRPLKQDETANMPLDENLFRRSLDLEDSK